MIDTILSYFGRLLVTHQEYRELKKTLSDLASSLAYINSGRRRLEKELESAKADAEQIALVCDEQRMMIGKLTKEEEVTNCTACVSPANRMHYQLNFDGVCPRCKKEIC